MARSAVAVNEPKDQTKVKEPETMNKKLSGKDVAKETLI